MVRLLSNTVTSPGVGLLSMQQFSREELLITIASIREYVGMAPTRNICNRPYAIPYVTKRETDSGRKSRYYAAILSGKEDRGIGA